MPPKKKGVATQQVPQQLPPPQISSSLPIQQPTKKVAPKKTSGKKSSTAVQLPAEENNFEFPKEIIKSPYLITGEKDDSSSSKDTLVTKGKSSRRGVNTRKRVFKSSSPMGCASSSPTSRSVSSFDGGGMASLMISSLEENYKNIQKLHLVIDLDATFVSTSTDDNTYNKAVKILSSTPAGLEVLKKRVYLFTVGKYKMWTILRPGALEFIEFASFYFKRISVWSAGQKDYVDQIVSFLFPGHIPRPSLVFNWDDCAQEVVAPKSPRKTSSKAASPSNQEYVTFTKPLMDMIPYSPKGEGLEHMLILDDRKDIAEKNIENLVQIPPYEPNINYADLTGNDNCLDRFVEWLMRPDVIGEKDIRKVDKSKIFKDAVVV
jgi:hypothetical protein